MFLYCLFMVSFCNKYLWLHLYLPVYVLYCSKVGRFRGRCGVRCSNESKHLYKIISIFYKCRQTIKLRKNNWKQWRTPSHGKVMLKGYLECQKATPKRSWPSFNMWRVGSEIGLDKYDLCEQSAFCVTQMKESHTGLGLIYDDWIHFFDLNYPLNINLTIQSPQPQLTWDDTSR